jgi:hypothetical protein
MDELAEDIIDRVPTLYKEVLRRDKPSASDSSLDEMVAGDLPEIMPGSKSAIVGIMVSTYFLCCIESITVYNMMG